MMRNFADDCRSRPGLWSAPLLLCMALLAHSTGNTYAQTTTRSSNFPWLNEENLPVRLVGSSLNSSGRVEIYRNGVWGTVCDDGWDVADAAVVCRQLGFDGDSVAYQSAYFGMGDGPILMDDVWCSGNETHLSECRFPGFGVHNCNHQEDAGVACNVTSGSSTTQRTTSPRIVTSPNEENLPVRLVGSSTSSSGRVEIYRNGVWGTVCDDLWDDADAAVVCRQLGFNGDSVAYQSAYFGMGVGPILMDDVQCSGNETHLSECRFRGFGVHDCSHGEDAGVACNLASSSSTTQRPIATSPIEENLPVRLVGSSSSSSGRVEIYRNGAWGTVCDDLWDNADAAVVCRQLGFYGDSVAYQSAYFGVGYGPILMDDVQCSGNETHLSECRFLGFGVHNCGHHEDAGVACDVTSSSSTTQRPIATSPIEENLPVRLVGSSSSSSGRVEIYRNGVWGTVCDDLWDDTDAAVVCRQLGFDGDSVAYQSAYFGMGDDPILMDNVQCSGNETHLSECLFLGFGVHNCNHGEDAGVACNVTFSSSTTQRTTSPPIVTSPVEENLAVRLVGSSSNASGRVEIYRNGVWGTVCDDFWDNTDAAVVCGQLGFNGDSVAYQAAYFGMGDGPILMDNVQCIGSETHLSQCLFPGFGVHDCIHGEDAGVACNVTSSSSTTQSTTSPPIVTSPNEENLHVRLVGSSSSSSGRVEIYRNGVWGTVCDDLWDDTDAAVVCRQLGFDGDSVAYQAAYFGMGDGPILMDNVHCSGIETHLSQCLFPGFGVHDCSHGEDAGVACNVTSSRTTTQPTTSSPIVTSTIEENLPVRLVGSSSSSSGRVEIYRNGVWGTVCDDMWDNVDASVVCGQLGFNGDSVAYQAAYFGMGDGPILMDNVQCTGIETHLSECLFPGFGFHDCSHGEDAGVACNVTTSGSTTESTTSPPIVTSQIEENLPVRLVGSSSNSSGRVEIYRYGVWGTVCDDLWDDTDATVVCRQLGFNGDSVAYQSAYFGMGDGPILMDNVQCSGNETHLSECLFPGFGVHDCSHGEDAGVTCFVTSNICPEGQDTYFADENNPGRYYQCDNGVPRLRECAPSTVWDQASLTCVHDGSQQAQEENLQHGDECDPSTTYYPHADCTKFIMCLYGIAYEIPCPNGLRYNPAITNCDFADNVPCPQRQTD